MDANALEIQAISGRLAGVVTSLRMRVRKALPDCPTCRDSFEQWCGAMALAQKYEDKRASDYCHAVFEQLLAAMSAKGVATI